jgi:hypothetical protein
MEKIIRISCYVTFIFQISIELISLILHILLLSNSLKLKDSPIKIKEIKNYLIIKNFINILQDFIGFIIALLGFYFLYFKISKKIFLFII